PFVRIDNDGPVLHGDELLVPGVLERRDHPVELPRAGTTARVVVLPADVDLQQRLARLREVLLEVGELHHPLEVIEDGVGTGVDDGNERLAGWGRRGRWGRTGLERHDRSVPSRDRPSRKTSVAGIYRTTITPW